MNLLKKGDTVKIIDRNHVGFNEILKIRKVTKHEHKLIILYMLENEDDRYYCGKEQLMKIGTKDWFYRILFMHKNIGETIKNNPNEHEDILKDYAKILIESSNELIKYSYLLNN